MSARSLDQERAAFAWRATEGGQIDESLASGAPALVMSNGLMQTLAYYKDKGHRALLEAITSWIGPKVLGTSGDFANVMNALHGGDSARYMLATEEALEILRWIRQFAKARAGGEGA